VFQLKKREPLSLIPARAAERDDAFDVSTGALDESFQGWLQKVSPPKAALPLTNGPARRIRPMTTRELLEVERATIRESYEHSVWPKEAFVKFLTADVITSKATPASRKHSIFF
jgi:hypothetical protein